MSISNSTKSLEKYLGKKFIDNIEMRLRLKLNVICGTQFEIVIKKDEVIDFSIFEQRDLLVIGFPFQIKDDDYVMRQHREYYLLKPEKGTSYLVDNVIRITRAYLNGDYDLIKYNRTVR